MWWCVALILVLYILFDVSYFLRLIYLVIDTWTQPTIKITDVAIHKGRCLSSDLDTMLHMNNARYLRECDFARIRFWLLSGIWTAKKRVGGHLTLGGTMIRYRRSLELGDKFEIQSKVLCWDEKAFYMENSFVREKDSFIAAIVYQKQTVIKASPKQIVKEISGEDIDSPPFPAEIQKFIECNQLSSESLKKLS